MAKLSDQFTQALDNHGFTPKEIKRYNLLLMIKIVDRMEQQSACSDCTEHLQKASELVEALPEIRTSREVRKKFEKYLNAMEQHLASKHKIVRKGHYIGAYMMGGFTLGALALIFFDLSSGMAIGMVLGLAIGAGVDKKAAKDGKVI